MRRVRVFLLGLVCALILSLPAAHAQVNSYKQTNLVSDTPGLVPVIDSNLVNPWGICVISGDDADAPRIDQIGIDHRHQPRCVGYQIGLLVAVHLGVGSWQGKNEGTD